MCGIFGYIGPRTDAANIVLEGLRQLEYRGYDSWGVAVVPATGNRQKIVVKKKTGKIGSGTVSDMPAGTLAFGHTRWATHGGVTDANAHPHMDCTGTIAIIHNGILENYETLKKRLLSQGHRFISDTDTEVAAHLIEEYAKTTMLSKAVQKAFNEMEGLNAFIVINTKDRQMVAVRNGSPLVVGYGTDENYLASDAAALLSHTKQVHFLEDDEIAIVDSEQVLLFNVRDGSRHEPNKQTLTWTANQAEKGKFPYFMLKEIHEQPGLVSEIASDSPDQAKQLAKRIGDSSQVYVVGCGTSAHAARAATYLFSHIAKVFLNWGIASEFDHRLNVMSKKSIIIALSQSGETMDLLEMVKKAKARSIAILALVNVVGSSLWRTADLKLPIGAGPEKGVASTKAFTSKIAHLILIAYAMKGNVPEGQKLLTRAAKAARDAISPSQTEKIKALAKKLKNIEHMFVIGRGISYAAALESALKIKEISYIHAEGVTAGELKHGPLALVTRGTVCMVFAPNDDTQSVVLSGAMEMKARGGYIIGVSDKPHEVFDEFIKVKDAGIATIIPNVMVGQLLAYYLTLERGFDPDMPRNLAKSVTVK